jgi:two-component system, cell cycle sensor histidine kinase and response regulator CckA
MKESGMDSPIRILIVEDLPADAGLAEREIRQTIKASIFAHADTKESFLAALKDFQPDVIVSDYRMPRFDGLAVLKLTLVHSPITPVIILTSAMNEDTAVECMRLGAVDYVIKEHIKRLGQAIVHAIEQKSVRLAKMKAEENIRVMSAAIESSISGIGLARLDGTITYANPSLVKLWKASDANMIVGHQMGGPTEDGIKVARILDVVRTGKSYRGIHEFMCFDGSRITVELSSNLVSNPEGEPLYLMASFVDISERVMAETALRSSETKFRTLVETIPDAVILMDSLGVLQYASPSALRLFGYGENDSPMGRNAIEWVDLTCRERMLQLIERVVKGTIITSEETVFLRKDGTTFCGEISASCARIAHVPALSITAIIRDTTARQELEAKLMQAQKMEAIGQLAGGVAHDFNNMIGIMLGYAIIIKRHLNPLDAMNKHADAIIKAAEHSSSLTKQLLSFARKQSVEPEVIDLNERITFVKKMLDRIVGEDIQMRFVPGRGLWSVQVDPTQIDQALTNLTTNARDAIENTGEITIETANVTVENSAHAGIPDAPPGEYVMLALSDTGKGMDKATLGRIFEPFFTTKPEGKGTGLGLPTVFGVMRQNNGFLSVESEPGSGTTFKLYFPRVTVSARKANDVEKPSKTRGTETILLVEDEQQLLDLAAHILRDRGYKVLAARSPGAALFLSKQADHPIHLLLTDVIMPEMNGKELREALSAARPDMKYLYMSGYTTDMIATRKILEEGCNFLQKPFSPLGLARKVREVLDAS